MIESMHYVNIFETKGLEHLLVISFLIGFIFLVRRLSYSHTAIVPAATSESVAMAANLEMVCPAGADCPPEQRRMAAEEGDRPTAADAKIQTVLGRFSTPGVESASNV